MVEIRSDILRIMNEKMIFGIDEAGRGPLAGPVAVAVFALPAMFRFRKFPKGKDSKKMTAKEREYWFKIFQEYKEKGKIHFEYAFVSHSHIDNWGIVHSIRLAMKRCLARLEKNEILTPGCVLLLDGALQAPKRFRNQRTIIKGDEKKLPIACASIVAKVTRDDLMRKLSKKYPSYGFERHKGYGTKAHRFNINKYGICEIHRKSYLLK